jgi:hypothetical protein
MKGWIEGLQHWWRWLVGESTVPNKRSGLMLAGTVVVVLLLVFGLLAALRSPARTAQAASAGKSTTSTSLVIPDSNLFGSAGMTGASNSGSGSGSDALPATSGGTGASGSTGSSGAAGSLGVDGKVKKAHDHLHEHHAGGAKTAHSPAPSATTDNAPTPLVAAAPTDPPSALADADLATDLPVTPSALPVTPAAPVVNNAVAGHDSVRISWSAPSTNGDSTIDGYNVYVGTTPGGESATPVNGRSLVAGQSYLASRLTVGPTYYFTVRAVAADTGVSPVSNEVSAVPTATYQPVGSLTGQVVGIASNPQGTGYWTANALGDVSNQGAVADYGSLGAIRLNAPIAGIASTPDGKGYWEVATDGGVFTFGDAHFYGSMGGTPLNAPVVGLTPTPDGKGYWEVAADGGVFAFGDAGFYGSAGAETLNAPVVALGSTGSGKGYWEVAADGGVFSFGDAKFAGSMGGQKLDAPVVGMAVDPTGDGYYEVAADGGVFSFGTALYRGSAGTVHLNAPIGGISVDQATGGYWLVGWDGGIFGYGAPFLGAG